MFENNIVVYKFVRDLYFFVTGGKDEDEHILLSVLEGFFDAVGILPRGKVKKKEAILNLDFIIFCLEEMIEGGGFTLETDANVIAVKVAGPPSSPQEYRPSIKNILLLDSEGKRIVVEYHSANWPTHSAREAFEKALFTKTRKTNAQKAAKIEMFENNIVVYKFVRDLHFFVTGGKYEDEHILLSVLEGIFDAVGMLLRGNVEKKEAIEILNFILDEMIDYRGYILQTDANLIALKFAGAPLSPQVYDSYFHSKADTRLH